MKKLMISALCIGMFAVQVSGQTPSFVKGDQVAGISIGFGGYYSGALYSGSGVSRVPAITLYYENCVKDNLFNEKSSLGIGGTLGYTSIKVSNVLKQSNIVIGARGALHYAFVDKLDTYTGLMLGYQIVNTKWDGYDLGGATGSGLVGSWFLGARYYFTGTLAGFAEIGYGVAIFNIGLALKF